MLGVEEVKNREVECINEEIIILLRRCARERDYHRKCEMKY